jgi:ABA responsive element binding factor
MDDLLKNIYADPEPFPSNTSGKKTFDEIWKETVTGACDGPGGSHREPGMTLEDFLEKAGAVREDDVRMTEVDSIVNASQFPMQPSQNGPTGYEMVSVAAVSGVGGGRGKRRVVEEPPVDKATQQKQRRMIKNRESAARSRERKQAYTVELESLVTQFEEENARLVREEAEEKKERLNQLMKNIIPVVEERRPPRSLRRTNSM